jgi:hypothetical protein
MTSSSLSLSLSLFLSFVIKFLFLSIPSPLPPPHQFPLPHNPSKTQPKQDPSKTHKEPTEPVRSLAQTPHRRNGPPTSQITTRGVLESPQRSV